MRKLWLLTQSVVVTSLITSGVLASLLLLSAHAARPVLFLVQVDGMSMYPTLQPGNELLFARVPFVTGDIVLADVGESYPVVKRVDYIDRRVIDLAGDNRACSQSYQVVGSSLLGVMVCKLPFSSPLRQAGEIPPMLACGGKPPQ